MAHKTRVSSIWQDHTAKPFDAFFVAQCFPYRIAKDNTGVFDGMVAIYFQISLYLQIQIKEAMSGKNRITYGQKIQFRWKYSVYRFRPDSETGQYLSRLFFSEPVRCVFLPIFSPSELFVFVFKSDADRICMCSQLLTVCKLCNIFVYRMQCISGIRDNA